jgi:Tfp pilus tip-associated adhesin PilY1
MRAHRAPAVCIGLLAGGLACAADCLPDVSVQVMVRIGDAPPVAAALEGGIETPLSLFEVGSRRLLWSAAAHATAIQEFPGMTAAFTGSIAAIDLDGDGLHDRIYAGDMAARVWRLDLHHRAAATQWATGGVFADFSNPEGRVFLAAPDISLAAPPGSASWLNLAFGTAAPMNPAANNRLYVLHDPGLDHAWSGEALASWVPVREEDLSRVTAVPATTDEVPAPTVPAHPGWYVELGSGHVVAPSLTVHNRVVLAIAEVVPRDGEPCEVFTRIAAVDLATRQVITMGPAQGRQTIATPIPANATFTLGQAAEGIAPCTLAGQRINACDVDTRPRRTWWRREDAQ